MTCAELIELFAQNRSIKNGCLAIFDDIVTIHGSTLHSLNNITYSNETLTFTFSNLKKIIVYNPLNVFVTEKVIAVDVCDKIDWFDDDSHIQYIYHGDEQVTVNGVHNFTADESVNAFMFYA